MKGAKRVVIFCLLTAALPTLLIIIPLYLRHKLFADVTYEVAESDVLQVGEHISTVFCQNHVLKMNSSFSAYQMISKPEISNTRKHIRLKKSMRLPDDTLEYWGFFLPDGSTVKLSVCSRYDGSRILVVRGEKNLRTCGLLDHTRNQEENTGPTEKSARKSPVRVRFEVDEAEFLKGLSTDTTTAKPKSLDEENNGQEDQDDDPNEENGLRTFNLVREFARKIRENQDVPSPRTFEESVVGHKLRHARSRAAGGRGALSSSAHGALSNSSDERAHRRPKRVVENAQPLNLDAKSVLHGGNAQVPVESDGSSDVSSFESALLTCYDGNILLTQEFPPSQLCHNMSFLEAHHAAHMTTTHNVTEHGYYYYIFYSDNDLVENDIYAVFDIHKPTLQLTNTTKKCVNETSCSFPLSMLTKEIVIVEVPTRDGIEHEEEDFSHLISICQPRMAVYIVFPLLVLMLILGCAFL